MLSAGQEDQRAPIHVIFDAGLAPPDLMSIRRCAMDRRRLSLLFGLFFAASILTPQGGAQEGIKFEMPTDDVKKRVVKSAAPSPATVEMLNFQSARSDSLTDGDALKLNVALDKPGVLPYVASLQFDDAG